MPNRLTTGAAWLRRQLRSHASDYVTYRRGASSVTLRATRGTSGGIQDSGDIVVAGMFDDFIVSIEDLVVGGIPVTPAPNDEIEDENGVKYRVSQNHPDGAFRYCEGARISIRIHTTRV